jgi:hypothetical protein
MGHVTAFRCSKHYRLMRMLRNPSPPCCGALARRPARGKPDPSASCSFACETRVDRQAELWCLQDVVRAAYKRWAADQCFSGSAQW